MPNNHFFSKKGCNRIKSFFCSFTLHFLYLYLYFSVGIGTSMKGVGGWGFGHVLKLEETKRFCVARWRNHPVQGVLERLMKWYAIVLSHFSFGILLVPTLENHFLGARIFKNFREVLIFCQKLVKMSKLAFLNYFFPFSLLKMPMLNCKRVS